MHGNVVLKFLDQRIRTGCGFYFRVEHGPGTVRISSSSTRRPISCLASSLAFPLAPFTCRNSHSPIIAPRAGYSSDTPAYAVPVPDASPIHSSPDSQLFQAADRAPGSLVSAPYPLRNLAVLRGFQHPIVLAD